MLKLAEKKARLDKVLSELNPPKVVKDKVALAKKFLKKEHLRKLDDGSSHYCEVTEATLPIVACLARVFLEGHVIKKKCSKCRLMDKFVDKLLAEIHNEDKG